MVADLLLRTLRHVVETLDQEGITWAVAGGIALSVWDHARYTKDADFLIGVENEDVDHMLAAFRAAGLQPKRLPPIVTVGQQRFVQFLYQVPDTDFKIQVGFLFAEMDFQRRALERRRATAFPTWDEEVFVLRRPDRLQAIRRADHQPSRCGCAAASDSRLDRLLVASPRVRLQRPRRGTVADLEGGVS
ncbi:MAG: hypothetical protein CMJ64_06505 [Planctomycetaceae bacterium]|nr:hypothetical protein [Planctomycetaceae bacterium]